MPKIDLCFQGWIRGVDVTKVTDVNGNPKDVSHWGANTLAAALNKGEVFLSLADHLGESDNEEIEIFDFTPSI